MNTDLTESYADTVANSYQLDTAPQKSPISLPQTYHYLSEVLHPEIAQQILSFQLHASNINFEELTFLIEHNCREPCVLVSSIKTLLNSCGHDLATSVFQQALSHAKMSICDIKSKSNWTMLHDAAESGFIDVVKLLLQTAHDKTWAIITAQDNINHWTPSHYAAGKNHVKISELLLKAAGDKVWALITEINERQTVLHVAVRTDSVDIPELLINTVGDKAWMLISKLDKVNGGTALHSAAKGGRLKVVTLLLDAAGRNAEELIKMLRYNKSAFDEATPEVKEIMKKYIQK